MRHDLISDVLTAIKNGDINGKKHVIVPSSSITKNILLLLQRHNYIGDFEFVEDRQNGKFDVQLIKAINNCGPIRPRFSVKYRDYKKYERRFLPASKFGILIISTPLGIMTHEEAKEKHSGGKLLAYIY